MPGSWSDFLKLRSGPAPPPSSEAGAVRVYADSNGALRAVQSDGTDAPIGGGSMLNATLALSSAQILALGDADVTLIEAQGINEIIVVEFLIARLTFVTAPYATVDALYYGVGSTTVGLGGRMNGVFSAVADTLSYGVPGANMDADTDSPSAWLNQPFVLGTGGNGNPTGGDSTVKVTALYSVLTIAA